MKCAVDRCNKEINEGKIIYCSVPVLNIRQGSKMIERMEVFCFQCVTDNKLDEKVIGDVNLLDT